MASDLKKYQYNDGSLSEKDFQKIRNYYGLAIPGILGTSICQLRGKKMSFKERYTSTYQASITGLVDDYYDEQGMTEARMESFFLDPNTITLNNDAEHLGIDLYLKSLKYITNFSELVPYLKDVNSAQSGSMQQQQNLPLSLAALKELTLFKGGSSFLYFRTAFQHKILDNEIEILYLLGGLTQLGNDIFDVYKDRENNIQTLLTTCSSINDVKSVFVLWLTKLKRLLSELNYPERNKRDFWNLYYLGVFSRCFTCLQQLEELEIDDQFRLSNYTRKELICDMEKWSSIKRALKFYRKGKI
ncbi:hypothetical protein [Flammeovirga kamogawensis]|uniref:Phytoene synthase n=1 Tax=Flammeovirga kamogawensis TaxID=373891 RepID=A0ABX8GZG7_9BACT|nr:hypothetical protein [Flammeovirga kamogawensis]MBB6458918.1 hypothetical protein [Flammeovirga kamogawensis]QWG08497.1 hypothetical protein KM029_06045 [Flammeovirga kamogawensis]TRX66791.1 hypothetical protein EO216_01095 [Flammeovirga kamogawensis]